MGSKSLISFAFSCIFICKAMLVLANQGISISTPKSYIDSPQKANVINCRAAFISVGDCYLEITRAYRTGQVRIFLGPYCCKAVQELNSGCWPNMFGINPFFPPILEFYCSQYQNGPPVTLFGVASSVEPSKFGPNHAFRSKNIKISASPFEGV